jgi:indolepyruvate ferredoxin oxidoreductase alpha subunit
LRDSLEAEGPAVVISQRECALLPEVRKQWVALTVNEERCNGCGLCFLAGCPAIVKSDQVDEKTGRPIAWIDPLLCTGCDICAQVCARGAILLRDEMLETEGEIA